jgi:hypothetical protein
VRISLELLPTEDDRLEGRVITEDSSVAFSGTLDLLRAIEELRRSASSATPATPAPSAHQEAQR